MSNNIPFLTTGGGHSYSVNLGKLKNGLELDMSGLTSVKVDAAASTMTIRGAVTFGDIEGPLYAAGKEIRKFAIKYLPAALLMTGMQQLAHAPAWGLLEQPWELAWAVIKAYMD